MLTVNPPLLGFCAYSGTGKTTLLTRLIPVLNRNGIKIGLIKHAHHQIELHRPILGKPLLCINDSSIIAFATDMPLREKIHLPVLDLNNIDEIAAFIKEHFLN